MEYVLPFDLADYGRRAADKGAASLTWLDEKQVIERSGEPQSRWQLLNVSVQRLNL
jgi:hypothetical protein